MSSTLSRSIMGKPKGKDFTIIAIHNQYHYGVWRLPRGHNGNIDFHSKLPPGWEQIGNAKQAEKIFEAGCPLVFETE